MGMRPIARALTNEPGRTGSCKRGNQENEHMHIEIFYVFEIQTNILGVLHVINVETSAINSLTRILELSHVHPSQKTPTPTPNRLSKLS